MKALFRSERDRVTEPGCYVLVVYLRRKKAIRVGKLGRITFPRGTYLYAGSARNGLRGRLLHHLKHTKKKKHWHIDYLLGCSQAKINKILIRLTSSSRECEWVRRLRTIPGAQDVAKGFGASDCVSGCASHLIYFYHNPMTRGVGKELPLASINTGIRRAIRRGKR